MMPHFSSSFRKGFALPATMLCLAGVLTALLIAAVGLRQRVTESTAILSDIRVRWASHSTEIALRRFADQLPDIHPYHEWHFSLEHSDLSVRLADEQAKLNVNAMNAAGNDLRQSVAVCQPEWRLHLALRPIESDLPGTKAYLGYGQIFDRLSVDEMFLGDPRTGPSSRLTCWGDGALFLRNADPLSLVAMTSSRLQASEARKLIDTLRASPGLTVAKAVEEMNFDAAARDAVLACSTDDSRCWSTLVVGRDRLTRHVRWSVVERVKDRPRIVAATSWQ
jgi:hypothetical protein